MNDFDLGLDLEEDGHSNDYVSFFIGPVLEEELADVLDIAKNAASASAEFGFCDISFMCGIEPIECTNLPVMIKRNFCKTGWDIRHPKKGHCIIFTCKYGERKLLDVYFRGFHAEPIGYYSFTMCFERSSDSLSTRGILYKFLESNYTTLYIDFPNTSCSHLEFPFLKPGEVETFGRFKTTPLKFYR